MINVKTDHGHTSLQMEGKGIDILADLTLINARVIYETNMPDDFIKMLFEGTLRALKMLREEEGEPDAN